MTLEHWLIIGLALAAIAILTMAYFMTKPRIPQVPKVPKPMPPGLARAEQHRHDAKHNPNYRGGLR